VEVTFKIRHTPEFTLGTIERTKDGFFVRSATPLQGIAAGQFGVIYDTDKKICFGSGEIA
jgi:tRNA-specific 2-thiouridylase